jgi:hypothetical protein
VHSYYHLVPLVLSYLPVGYLSDSIDRYAALQAHKIVNVALHRKYSAGIIFIFSQGRKDLYHV